MHRDLVRIVTEMVDKQVHFADAAREFERCFLEQALKASDGSITRTAALTGLHRNTLTRKIAEHQLKG